VRRLARLVLLGGGVALGLYLFRASPRDVTLVYDFGREPPRVLRVEILEGGHAVRRAELRQPAGAPGQVTHRVRLTDGEYTVRLAWDGDAAGRSVERRVTVEESGTVVLPVAR
jgi:hypothetical protein